MNLSNHCNSSTTEITVLLLMTAEYFCRELDYTDEERETLVRKLIVHSKNPDGQKRQKAIATLGVIGPKNSESILRAIAHGLGDKEVTTLLSRDSGLRLEVAQSLLEGVLTPCFVRNFKKLTELNHFLIRREGPRI